jgi:hypothetical protein
MAFFSSLFLFLGFTAWAEQCDPVARDVDAADVERSVPNMGGL